MHFDLPLNDGLKVLIGRKKTGFTPKRTFESVSYNIMGLPPEAMSDAK